MKEFKLSCPRCQQHIAVTEEWLGHRVTCPTCQATFKIQAPAPAPASYPLPPAGLTLAHAAGSPSYPASATLDAGGLQTEHCQQCGRVLPLGASFCARCGVPSGTLPPPPARSGWLPENLVAALPYAGGMLLPALLLMGMENTMMDAIANNLGLVAGQRGGMAMPLLTTHPLVFGPLLLLSLMIVGLICLLVDKRPFVRWHAVQAMVLLVGGSLLLGALVTLLNLATTGSMHFDNNGMPDFTAIRAKIAIITLVQTCFTVVEVLSLLSALVGRNFRAPIAASFADAWAGEQ
jgi:uncharacterized membrane protein